IAAAPESTLTNQEGTFLFSECTGLLLDVCLPDFNADGITDLRDFTLLAKQYGKDGESAGEIYDIAGNDSIDDTDLDYLKQFLFAGITGAEDVETGRMADRTLQAVYTVESEQQTRVTTYEYNAADQLTRVTDCNGNSVYYDYDSCGRLVKMTDQAGYASEILYDTAGNPVQVVLPEGVTETYTYDTEGNLLTVTDSLGAVTSYTYDAYGRTVSVTDAVGVTYQYQYDIAGNLVKNLFTGEEYCYNAYDEVVSFTDAEGNVTAVQYDAQGNVTDTTDALGNITSYTYRKDGLLTEIRDASGAVTLYEYNGKGLLAKETDALGAVTSYEYDRENRPVKVTASDGTVTEYSYNTDGSITKITATKLVGDNSAVEEKEELRYLYALDGSLTVSISSTDILAYTYDIRGYVESVTKNNSHTISLAYDGNGNLTLLKEKEAGTYTTDSITSYFYDTRGYLSEVRTGGNLTYHTTGYNQEGIPFLVETSEGGELLASYISRPDGLLEQMTDGAGTVTKYQYNQKKQVTGLTVTAADGTVQYRETNTYDRNGSLLTQTIGGAGYGTESLSYTYDELDRLLSETKNGKTTSYTYDSMGNRLTKTADGVTTSHVYDLCNKLLSETTGETVTEYAYDALGNLTAKTEAGGTTTYAYDALNQLTEVVNPDGTWQKNTYDASGIRSMVAENGITIEFMTFNGLVVSGYSKSGEQTEHYYYGNSLVAAEYIVPSVTPEVNYGEDTEDAETSLYYYLKNSHGDVIGLTNNTGTLTETYRYDAFGTLTKIQSLNENGVFAQTDTALSRFLYAGEQYDKVTRLYYLRARQYDTLTGRFTQEDTYLGDGRNLYVYVSGNPLKYVDPSGHDRECGVEKIQRQYVEINVVADFVTDITTGIAEVADILWNGVESAALGIFEGLAETPISVATKTTLKPYATNKVTYDLGKLSVELGEFVLGKYLAGLGIKAMEATVTAAVPVISVSGGAAIPVTLGVVGVLTVEAAAVGASDQMALASTARAAQTLGDFAEDTRSSGDENGKPTRRQSFRKAKEMAGIPKSAQYKHHKFVYDGSTENRIVYEFEVNGTSQYVIEHPFDKNGRGKHFHGADDKYGSPYNKGTYNQYDGHFPENFDGFE
ncbi:MAG: hypothetical protein J6A77_04200, partial [Lachnospiraceae bacterium]|nr:hypothetical protein [Lachnospiraceae bacterium]